jgi:threonine synthase
VPALPSDWQSKWRNLSFQELAYEIFSLYISDSEIPSADLKDIIHRSYATFRAKDVTPVVTLDKSKNLHLMELFHGPTFAFKDVALQFVGNLFEYFLLLVLRVVIPVPLPSTACAARKTSQSSSCTPRARSALFRRLR